MPRSSCKRLLQPRAPGDIQRQWLVCLTECQQTVGCENGRPHHDAGGPYDQSTMMLAGARPHREARRSMLDNQEVPSFVMVSNSLIIMNCRTCSAAITGLSRSG